MNLEETVKALRPKFISEELHADDPLVLDYVLNFCKNDNSGLLPGDSLRLRGWVFRNNMMVALCQLRDELRRQFCEEGVCNRSHWRELHFCLTSRKSEALVRKLLRERLRKEKS